jgi:site-specific recombinase XerD
MVTAGVSVITVAQALGHRAINSTKQYIALDSTHLKECALDFSGIQIVGDTK